MAIPCLRTHFDGEELRIGRDGCPVDGNGRIRQPIDRSFDCECLSSERGGDESEEAVRVGHNERNWQNSGRLRRT